jgi:predicted nucleic acid-binding protein
VILGSSDSVISLQVISEFTSTCLQKRIFNIEEVSEAVYGFMRALRLVPIKESTIVSALKPVKKYKFSYCDSLIATAALENDCSVLYTEDLQHGQLINNRLRITNPFHV